jgi:hypothetical protein
MHRKDDQYSPRLFLVVQNDFVRWRLVSAQKHFAHGAGQKGRINCGPAPSARSGHGRGGRAVTSSENKFYKSPQL